MINTLTFTNEHKTLTTLNSKIPPKYKKVKKAKQRKKLQKLVILILRSGLTSNTDQCAALSSQTCKAIKWNLFNSLSW